MSCSLWRSSKQAPPSQNSVMILQSKSLTESNFRRQECGAECRVQRCLERFGAREPDRRRTQSSLAPKSVSDSQHQQLGISSKANAHMAPQRRSINADAVESHQVFVLHSSEDLCGERLRHLTESPHAVQT